MKFYSTIRFYNYLNFTAICLLIAFMVWMVPAVSADFRVGILGDRTGGADQQVYENILENMNALNPDFVINVGDLIEGPQRSAEAIHAQWDLVLKPIRGLKCPFYYVPGNNDIFDELSRELYSKRTGARPYYSFDYETTHFVILDNSETRNFDGMDSKQIEWLKADLKTHRAAELTCVFFHKPFWYDPFEKNEACPLHEIFKDHGVDWVFSGHYHRYVSTERDGIRYVMIGSSGGGCGVNTGLGEFYHFGWFQVSGGNADLSIIKADSILGHDFFTLEDRMARDRFEEHFVTIKPLKLNRHIPSTDRCEVMLSSKLGAVSGKYRWNTDGTFWTITPNQGLFDVDVEDVNLLFRCDITDSSIYPLPKISLSLPVPDSGNTYELTRFLRWIPQYELKSIDSPLKLDGNLTEKVWQDTPEISQFGGQNGRQAATEPFIVRMAKDIQNLYIAVDARESMDKDYIHVERDGPVFAGDCLYMLFWSKNKPVTIYQYVINPMGDIMDQKGLLPVDLSKRPKMEISWNSDIDAKSSSSSKGWALEITCPLKDLGLLDGAIDPPSSRLSSPASTDGTGRTATSQRGFSDRAYGCTN